MNVSKSLPKESNIIIIENSNDLNLKEKLEQNIQKLSYCSRKQGMGLQIILELNYVKQIMLL